MKICLMASHGYSPNPELLFYQDQSRVIRDCPPYFPSHGARHEIKSPNSLALGSHQLKGPSRPTSIFSEQNQCAKIESTVEKPVLIDVRESHPDSAVFSFGIAERCNKHEKILKFLTSGSSELEKGGLDLPLLSDLMDIQVLTSDVNHLPYHSLIYPSGQSDTPKALVDFVGELSSSSKLTVHPDGRVLFTGTGKEMKDILSVVAEFYLSKNSTTLRRHSVLVPQFSWPGTSEAQSSVITSSLRVKDVAAAPLKRSEKIRVKPATKKTSKRSGRERDLFQRSYFHTCESLLSLMIDKKQHRKTTLLTLKKSGPELPALLTQFSAGIAGTGLAVLFSVVCKVACGRVPICSSKLLSTGFGFGLIWLSWAVNRLKDTVVYINKNASKSNLKDEEMLRIVDKSLKDVYLRAATLMAVALLRLA
ncbi:uncharacterized protein [Euphorbia lathyris]|uniref:uncharacterized protein n=1 Tax=Euphorbia lathyris TaxID=212925 RepID=UPI0033137596